MHFPLRPGADVLVGFVQGDPDRPIIVGTAPNPTTASPVQQSNQTQNVLRSGSNNEVVMEDLRGDERVRIHSPREDSTIQLGSHEEPETGILLKTDANASIVAGKSSNVITDRQVAIARTSMTLAGDSAIFVAGLPSVNEAADEGFEDLDNLSSSALAADLARLAEAPPRSDEPDDESSGDEDLAANEASEMAQRSDEQANEAAFDLVRAVANAADTGLDDAKGRSQGQALGEPLEPAFIAAAEKTAALIGREVAIAYGDRAAAVASADTAMLVGDKAAQVKSAGEVEIAAAETLNLTTAGHFDVAAAWARIVAGYYPDAEAPPLPDDVTLGIMSRKDMRIHSIEDCILICAHKHIVATAHTGDIRLIADQTISMKAGSIVGSAGSVSIDAGGITVKAKGDIKITAGGDIIVEAANVKVTAGTIDLVGTVTVDGDLTVTGKSNL
jgi:hypothetical protein